MVASSCLQNDFWTLCNLFTAVIFFLLGRFIAAPPALYNNRINRHPLWLKISALHLSGSASMNSYGKYILRLNIFLSNSWFTATICRWYFHFAISTLNELYFLHCTKNNGNNLKSCTKEPNWLLLMHTRILAHIWA